MLSPIMYLYVLVMSVREHVQNINHSYTSIALLDQETEQVLLFGLGRLFLIHHLDVSQDTKYIKKYWQRLPGCLIKRTTICRCFWLPMGFKLDFHCVMLVYLGT